MWDYLPVLVALLMDLNMSLFHPTMMTFNCPSSSLRILKTVHKSTGGSLQYDSEIWRFFLVYLITPLKKSGITIGSFL